MGIPIRNNAQYSKYFTKLLIPSLHNFKVRVCVDGKVAGAGVQLTSNQVNWKVLSNDPTRNILVFFATAHGDSAVGPYDNEYICILRYTKDGTQITQIEEFLDSKFTADFFARLYLDSHKKNPAAKL